GCVCMLIALSSLLGTPGTYHKMNKYSKLNLRSVLVWLEVRLARSAHGAEPVVGDVLEGGSGRNAAVRVPIVLVVDEPARVADPLLRLCLGRHLHLLSLGWGVQGQFWSGSSGCPLG